MLLLVQERNLVIQNFCSVNCVGDIWLKEDSFTYALGVKQGVHVENQTVHGVHL